jgi:hypothetical protein
MLQCNKGRAEALSESLVQIGPLVLTFVIVLAAIWAVSCAGVFWLFRNELQNKG